MNIKAGRLYLFLAVLALAGPFIPLMIASVSFRWTWPDLLPSEWWWEVRGEVFRPVAWDFVFSSALNAGAALLNTVGIALAVTLLATLLCLPAARVIATERFPGRSALEFFLLTPLIVPEIAIGLGLLVLFIQLGLAGSLVGVVLAHLIPVIPYTMRVLISAFQNLGQEVEAQARTLGASPWQVAWYVSLPLILPGLAASALFAFLVSSNLFLLTFYVGRGQIETFADATFFQTGGGRRAGPGGGGVGAARVVAGGGAVGAARALEPGWFVATSTEQRAMSLKNFTHCSLLLTHCCLFTRSPSKTPRLAPH